MSGLGAAVAMAGAYALAGELDRAGGAYAGALGRYQALMAPEIARKQELGLRLARFLLPSSRLGIRLRDACVGLTALPPVSKVFIERFVSDALRLDDYGHSEPSAPGRATAAA
jgi:2-polyprenyl-6-methoxyphenol hydroxylase-like FAD-dependent oxidoreductase